ncbi:hypothetical protein SCA6_005082 [Theobroma cacao]
MDIIKHFLHRHPLSFIDKGNEELFCSRCLKHLSGPTYGCSRCKFFIHDHCAELPPKIEHFLHPCPLVLKVLPLPVVYNCNLCIEPGAGSSYRCEECKFDMHVECALKPTLKSEGEELIQHFTHWHPLQLVLEKNKEEDQVCCLICQKLCSGSATAYGCKQCEFFLHNSCMTSIPRKINHFFHPCPLILLTSPFIYTCGGCDERGSFLTFSCGRCCFQLDVKCALLPTVKSEDAKQIQHFSHQHPLALRESINGSEVRCRACEEICSGPTYTFGCSRCSFFFHRSCAVELPQQIHHPFHSQHPLTLSSFPLKNFQYYCAACGLDVRSLLAYRCDKCEFTLHKNCAKLTPSFKYGPHPHLLTLIDKTDGIYCDICRKKANNFCLRCVAYEQSTMSSRIISTDEENSEIDPVLAKLDEEIAKLREKAKPFKLEIESLKRLIQKLQARLQELEAKLEPITWGLDKLEEDRFLYMYELKHKMKGKHSIEASP